MINPRPRYLMWLPALLLALIGLAFLTAPAFACGGTVKCVDENAPAGGDGQSWGTAYRYLQDALTAATSGNEIWVAEGVYYPDEGAGQTAGRREATFLLKSHVTLYGGFAATETLRTQRDWDAHTTVLSGDLAGNDTTDAHGVVLHWADVAATEDNTYQIVTAGYYNWGAGMAVTVDDTAVLDGFTITAGKDLRNATLQGTGAGLFAYLSNPTLRHLVFSGNQARVGGGVYLWEGPAITMTDLTFTGNVATQGGGLYGRDIPLTLDQFVFQNNETRNLTAAVQFGGGMAATGKVTLANGQFTGNTADGAGGLSTNGGPVSLSHIVFDGNRATGGNSGAGGMVSEGGDPVLTDVTFVNNSSNGWGGGYYHQNSGLSLSRVSFIDNANGWGPGGGFASVAASVTITDALFAGNRATDGPGGGLIMQSANLTMTNATFQGNSGVPGGGLSLDGVTAALRNVTVSGNQAYEGGGIRLRNGSSLQLSNSIIYGNYGGEIKTNGSAVNAAYSIVGGGCSGLSTCDHVVDADPAFVLPVVESAVPTSTGNLRLFVTSPAIDAGDNGAVPAGLTTDLDGNPRFIDTPAVTDSGLGTPPLVDRGAYEFLGKPDLRVQKTDDVGGAVAADTPFHWTLTISNAGGDTAAFAANTVVLQDDLPSANASYGASASVEDATGLSGPLNCTVSAYTLICRANGGPVTLAAAGQFTVAVSVNTSGIPILVNPRSGGACRVDPNDVVSELLENNNTCNSDTVAVGQTSLTVAMHDAAHTPIVQAPVGAMIHATISVTGVGATPTGATHLYRYDNSTCSGSPTNTNNQNLVDGAVETTAFAATSFYYRALYSGDSSHEAVYSPCTSFRAYQPGPTFVVNTAADDDSTVDGFMCTDVHCTLREAILAANAASGANTILFRIGSGQTITLTSAPPAINDAGGELTIDGQAYAVTVSGDDQYRPFAVNSNVRATLANLTLVHGHYTGGDCGLRACGGGLKVGAGAAVTLTHSAILSSTATGSGGGIYNAGTLIIQQSTVAGSSADEGGGILNDGSALVVRQSTLTGNTSLYGGGILQIGGTVTLENSTLSGNTATGVADSGGGGAFDLYNGTADIINSTIVSNTAVSPNQVKSGIWVESGALSLHNSIVAHNGGTNNFQRSGGTFTSLGYNLSNAWNGLPTQTSDLTANPRIGPLADNGGETLTHGLLPSSPAIDGGDPGYCPATDQRDVLRPYGLRCDIGSVEATTDVSLTKAVSPGAVPFHGVVTYTIVISNASAVNAPNVILTDPMPADVAFGQWLQKPGGALVQNSNAFTWTGNLTAGTALAFEFTATHIGGSLKVITNTASFSSTRQTGSDGAACSVTCLGTLTVQNANDSGPGSLREAIANVCNGGTIDFAPSLAGQTIGLTSAELAIGNTVTITNPNAPGLQLSGNNARRIFSIQSTGVVTLSSLAVVDGMADYGGGIVNEGVLVINAGAVSGNRAGGGYFNTGGAIYNAGILTIDHSIFDGNQSDGDGGGISNYGTLTANNSTFSGNQAGNEGGGINNQVTLTLNNTTFSGNQAGSEGGGITNYGTLTANNTTFSDNQAGSGGGGISNYGTLHLRNSIIANSPAGGDCRNHATVATNANNLIASIGSDACGITNGANGSLVGVDPLLSSLGDYGAPTPTFALLAGSPAIDSGANCLSTDQRGVARPQGTACDIGAFESRGFTFTSAGGSGQSTLINTAFANPLTATVTSGYNEPLQGGQVIFTAPSSGAGTDPAVYTVTIDGETVTQVITANNTVGSYVITATARGNLSLAAGYTLTNTAPEIAVVGSGATIASGDATPDPADQTDFGRVAVSGGQVTHTFTISNSGGYPLNLTGSPVVSLTGAMAGDFSVVTQPDTPVDSFQSTTFQVRFDPSLTGPQVVSVTIANDDGDENPYTFAIAGTGTIPGVEFTQAAYQVNEDGTTVGAGVSLTRTGEVDGETRVQVAFTDNSATGNGTDYASSPITITFPAGDLGAQTVNVPITQDFLAESTESLTMTVTSLSNAQIGSQSTALLRILDDDVAGVTVTPSGGAPDLTIAEPDGSDTFAIRLNTQPTAVVTFTLVVSDSSECTLSPSVVELSERNWSAGVTVTVTALDDWENDGPQGCNVTYDVASSDPDYDGQTPDNVAVMVNDDDVAGIAVVPTALTLPEASGTAAITVSLSSQPTNNADVTVPLASTCTVVSPSVTIPFAAWTNGVSVTVTALNDDVDNQPDRTCFVTTGDPTSAAAEYEALAGADVADVSVTLTDDETAGFDFSPLSGETSEDGGVFTVTLRLNSQPTGTVVIAVTSSDSAVAAVDPSQLTFTPLDWNRVQTVTVTGLDDGDNPAGDVDYSVRLAMDPATADPLYAGLKPAEIAAVNLDNDVSRIYLPLILRNSRPAPDLVVDSLTTGPSGPRVTIRNAGNSAVADPFWVDVYYDPNPAPPPLNRTWQSIAPYGAYWGVTRRLAPSETLTLTIGGKYYFDGSNAFPAGLPVYAYVDSVNYATSYGNVKESNEANNVLGPVTSTAATASGAAVRGAATPKWSAGTVALVCGGVA